MCCPRAKELCSGRQSIRLFTVFLIRIGRLVPVTECGRWGTRGEGERVVVRAAPNFESATYLVAKTVGSYCHRILFFFLIDLFIFWLCWVFVSV